MIKRYPYEALGHANHGWLDARHHFSFARYWDDSRVHFGALRVINDDRVSAGSGFGKHPHDNMEIITYVRAGAITHEDSLGNKGRTGAGDVQVMSAGKGVLHSEANKEQEDTRLYQIWILPNKENVAPRWEARAFPKAQVEEGPLPLLVSGREEDAGKGALFIHQDAAIYGGRLGAGTVMEQPIKHQAYILASEGTFTLNGVELHPGDGAEVTGESSVAIRAGTDAEILVIDVPAA
ncbi:MAG: pirin family protein [Pseudomonadota bacterium]|nr:pirin family protein [Pseudomonadota bacterium]